MPRARKQKRTVKPWTAADLRALRGLARRESVAGIATKLRRTESAVRQKAAGLGTSLRVR